MKNYLKQLEQKVKFGNLKFSETEKNKQKKIKV